MKKKLFYLFLLFPFVSLLAQKNNISALQEQLSNAPSDSTKIELSIQLLKSYTSIDLDSSIYYFEKAVDLAKKNKNTQALIKSYGTIGFSLVDKGEYARAGTYLDKGLELGHELNDNLLIARILIYQGNLNWEISNLKKALETFNEALKYANKSDDLKSKGMILNTLGLIYGDLEQREKQLSYYNQAKETFIEVKDTFNQALALYNITELLIIDKKLDEALPYSEQTMSLAKTTQSRYPVFYEVASAMRGELLIKLGNEKEGFSLLESALNIAKKNGHTRSQIIINTKQAECYSNIGHYDEAIQSAIAAVEISNTTDYVKELSGLCEILAKSYKAKKDYKASLFWIEEEIKAKQEIAERQKNKEVLQLETNYTIQQKEAENQILLLKNKNQKILIALLIASGLIFSFFVFSYFERKQKKKLEIFRQRIAADLHDDVGSNLNSITRIAKGIQSKNNNKNLNEGINQLVKKSNTTIRNVVDVIWALDNEDSKLEDLIEKMEDYLDGIKMTNKDVEVRFVKKNIPKNIPLPMNAKHHLLMVFKEAINNIQKHTNPSSVEVTMEYNQKNLDLNITNQFQSKKENTNSTGRGIINIRHRIMDLGGVVEIKETDNEFQLQIKVDNLL